MKSRKRAACTAVLLLIFVASWISPQAGAQLGGVIDTVTDTVNDTTSTLTGGTSTGGTTSTSSGDTTPPTVSMSAPANGATVSGTIIVRATASDNVGVAGVQFKLDNLNNNLGAEERFAPYEISWNTTTVANGQHLIAAVARDAAGNSTTSSPITITVANGTTSTGSPPSVSVTFPSPGATVSGTIMVRANASDDGGIAGVQFKLDSLNNNLGAEERFAPYEISWNTTTVCDGQHTIAAVARDNVGRTTTSAPVTFTVANGTTSTCDTTPPTVSIASPTAGATVSGTVRVTANASDSSGIAVVRFFVDGATTPSKEEFFAPYEFDWVTTAVSDGSHTVTAVAHDKAGNTNSASVTVTVANNTTPPPPTTTRTELESLPVGTLKGPTGEPAPPDQSWGALGADTAAFSPAGCTGFCAATSNVTGSTATFTFSGTEVSWIGLRCNVCGIARVSIDGTQVGEVDTTGPLPPGDPALTSPTRQPEVVFTASGLQAGTHTLVITVTGTTTSPGGAFVVVDAFDVTQ